MTEVIMAQPADLSLPADLFGPEANGEPTTLRASRCPACGRYAFPLRRLCPACGRVSDPVGLSGPARLRVLTAVLAQPPGALVQAPYEVGVAEFDEGICVIGLVVGPSAVGDRVVPVVCSPYPGARTYGFRPVPA